MHPENPARQETDERWRTAFENSAIGITMADFSGRFFAANSAFLNLLGYTESELYQLTFIDVTFEEDRERNRELVRELVLGTRQHFEIEKRYRRKDGTLVWARINAALVPGSGGAEPFWFGIVEDITQRKHVEGELTAELTAMTRLHDFSTHLLAVSEFQPLLEEILDDTIALQNSDFGNILRYNPDVGALEMVARCADIRHAGRRRSFSSSSQWRRSVLRQAHHANNKRCIFHHGYPKARAPDR